MSSSSYFRSWMDGPMLDPESNLLNDEYARGVGEFMELACQQPIVLQTRKLKCPCSICRNSHNIRIDLVWGHLSSNGFMPGYKIWFLHGERPEYISSSEPYIVDSVEEPRTEVDYGVGTVEMVNDAYRENMQSMGQNVDRLEEPNAEACKFFSMLDAAKQPLYEGCREGHSALSSASRLMTIKTDYNLAEECVDAITDFVKDILPEDNHFPGTYYEIQKLVAGLGLPYQMIDVCEDNCMIYWREDEDRTRCRFCQKPRYQETSGRVPVPYKRMWYLPITERLKQLYQSERTAGPMRWHAEHRSNGEITHPSDAEAWRHFQSVYPDFAYEPRNVYLGLSTDGFNPFGKHGRQYSLWPVIVTPYNLPPSLCMRREFLFLSILVPGPDHPKRSLDVFLQPLIYELKMLWDHGATAYDVSTKQNFQMRAALMWTISDFPAYGMLSGWSTHGRLACPYCQDNTDAFQLRHGRKTSWFDCHRRFLPARHLYRRSRTLFRKNKQVVDAPPPEVDGNILLEQLRDFGAERTTDCGGNGHVVVYGAGINHNWYKHSIFWVLPYWKDLLLKHNLDVMHIGKNVFHNLMNTVLNVPGKTKDNLKSRLDLPDICDRDSLHVLENGRCPVPSFRLDTRMKEAFFHWITHNIKFPDEYASNLRNCVDMAEGKFTGMKSHDCHVVMQRLLPFAFEHLLPSNVHQAIAGVGAFFRDLCSRTLTVDGIRNLEENIPMILCNLEKIFPPSFFDVMEHLPIHLPREAKLGGPVQYRWMYPFERYMFHLKKKVKNLSKVEGSIVAQSINEEASNFAEFYFPAQVRTKRRRPTRHDDGGEVASYSVYVPNLFTQVGRLSGTRKNRQLSQQEYTHLHMYILTNCEDIMEYKRIYMALIRSYYPTYTEEQLDEHKQRDFAPWLKYYVNDENEKGQTFPTWLVELVNGSNYIATSCPGYCTRGYAFRIHEEGSRRKTTDSGISSHTSDVVYYGVLREILEVRYPGIVDQFGVTSVNIRRRLVKYDPFILASQADQVCYIRHPRVSNTRDRWVTVTQIYRVADHDPLQPSGVGYMAPVEHSFDVDLVVDFSQFTDDRVDLESEDEIGEFDGDDSLSFF
ncbi:PREDICTED: uncharacterized protein LOC104793884 [Camelina sativa]|uniref:Uncharacterized protein LOC104793884 n=1 Tax=Camelina sativa TaxID=90675 RepID=A0ABM0ZPC3_CAMSA|nr:PREDICTED: uncharacterized protein LOC104793884 [Camelina sativa]